MSRQRHLCRECRGQLGGGPEHWRLLAGFDRLLSQFPERAGDYEADVKVIQQLEAAAAVVERGAALPAPLAFSLIADLRRLLAALFRIRLERDRFRAELHLLEQGQPLLFPLTEPQKTAP